MGITFKEVEPDENGEKITVKPPKPEQAKPERKQTAKKSVTEPNQELLDGFNLVHSTLEMAFYSAYGIKAFDFDPEDENIKRLCKKIENLANLYSVDINSKGAAWFGLAFTVFTIYGTQFASIKMQMAMLAEENKNDELTG